MVKSVGFFPQQCARNSVPIMSAMLNSMQKFGIQTVEDSWDSDAAIIWSVLWHGRMQANRSIYEHYRSQKKPIIIVDIGTLHRNQTWKVAVNHINARGFYGHNENLDYDRPSKLKIKLGTIDCPNDSILVAVQHRNSEQFAGINVEQWIAERIAQIRSVTDRPIKVRPHPRSPINTSLMPKGIELEKPMAVANTYDSFDFNTNYHAVVNHNSGPGILAAINGARPVVDESSLAYPVRVSIDDIENPYVLDRSQWLVEICHTEYTVDELEQGLWIKRLEQAL